MNGKKLKLIRVLENEPGLPARVSLPLHLEPQSEGGYTVTCPIMPEFITEGDSVDDALSNAIDALKCAMELYAEDGRSLPAALFVDDAARV